MKIHGLTVCVNYAEQLELGLARWRDGLESLVVVTDTADVATHEMCAGRGVRCFATDAFYAHGAAFNKGAAMSAAVDAGELEMSDWVLLFDADVTPPRDWHVSVEQQRPQVGTLYGARRYQATPASSFEGNVGGLIPDATPAGYFLLFHGSDPGARVRPLLPACYLHAGNYDTDFLYRWAPARWRFLEMGLAHHGEPGCNWWGVGNTGAMSRMRAERAAGKHWRDERINTAIA